MKKLLHGLFLLGNLTAAVYAMEDPRNFQFQIKVKDNNLCLHTKLPNSDEYSGGTPLVDLKRVSVDNWLIVGHVNNLKLVCKEWSELINKFTVAIKDSDYNTLEMPQKLRDNSSVIHLTFRTSMETLYDDSSYETYSKSILAGLRNKPELKTLTIESFSIGLFFNYSYQLNSDNEVVSSPSDVGYLYPDKNPPVDLLKLPHLACFLNLEELEIKELESADYNWDTYFLNEFINPQVLPNLKRFIIKSRGIDRQF